jgi:hypothetical protein
VVALELHPVCSLQNFHRRVTGQQIDHHALVLWIEMLDQHEGHAAAGWQRIEELLERVEAARRSPEPHNREIDTLAFCKCAPVRLRPGLAGLWRATYCHCFGFRGPWFP